MHIREIPCILYGIQLLSRYFSLLTFVLNPFISKLLKFACETVHQPTNSPNKLGKYRRTDKANKL